MQITEDLVGFPHLRVRQVADTYHVSFEAANRAVARLVDAGILHRVGDRKYDRTFVARSVMQALTST